MRVFNFLKRYKLYLIIVSLVTVSLLCVFLNRESIIHFRVDGSSIDVNTCFNSTCSYKVDVVGDGEVRVNSNNTSGTLTFNNNAKSNVIYTINELEEETVYKASVKLKTNMEKSDEFGAVIGSVRYSPGFTYGYSSFVGNSDGTVTVSAYFIADLNNTATIFIGSPYYSNKDSHTGYIEYSDLQIEKATDVTVVSSDNGLIKIAMLTSEYNKLDGMDGITNKERDSKNYVNKLAEVYVNYAEFAGQNTLGKGNLYPYKRKGDFILYFNRHNYGALAGYPIEFNSNWTYGTSEIALYAKTGQISFAEIHEIGHTFDSSLMSSDFEYSTKADMWKFDAEAFGSLKPAYVIQKGVVTTPEDWFQEFEKGYNESLGNVSNRTYDTAGMLYLMTQTRNSQGMVDWTALQKTFTWYNSITDTKQRDMVSTSTAAKFIWFSKKFSEFSTDGYKNFLDVLNESGALEAIKSHFNYVPAAGLSLPNIDRIYVGESISGKATATNANFNGMVIYESSDPSIATIDEFGNITGLQAGKVQITAKSYYEPNISATTDVNITMKDADRVTVTYITNSDATVNKYIGYKGDVVSLPNVERAGYTFGGWYLDEDFKEKYGNALEEKTMNLSRTLYAKWITNTYELRFVPNNNENNIVLSFDYEETISFPTFEKSGYYFSGWYTDSALTQRFTYTEMPNESYTLYAKWTTQKVSDYTITFNSNGGSSISKMTASYGDKITAPTTPTKTGYIFDGWYTNSSFTNSFEFDTMPNQNITLYAKWKVRSYLILLIPNNDDGRELLNFEYQEKVVLPTVTREGYIFDGWYTDSEFTEKFVYSEMPAQNFYLYGKWKAENAYTITFETNGGNNIASIYAFPGESITAPNNPAKEGYTFDGWYTNSSLTNKFTFDTMPNQNLTLYAKWNLAQYPVLIDPDNDDGYSLLHFYYKQKLDLPTVTKTGYTFDGWYFDSELTSRCTYTEMPSRPLRLYAKWIEGDDSTQEKYTIAFETSGGSIVSAILREPESSISAPASPTRVGYSFDGWYTDRSYTTRYTFDKMPNQNITLYAKWTKKRYTIKFNSNGGSAVNQISELYQEKITEPQPTREGYIFDGWYRDNNLNTRFTFNKMPAENITLYAKWIKNTYTVIFKSNGGTYIDSVTVSYDDSITEPTISKTGNTFDGWYTDGSFHTKYSFSDKIKNNLTLYAKWNPNSYTITFDSNGGSNVSPITTQYGIKVIQPTNPTKNNMTFAGWYTDKELNNRFTFDSMPADNITLYAKWISSTLKIDNLDNSSRIVLKENKTYTIEDYKKELKLDDAYELVVTYKDKDISQEENIPTGSVVHIYSAGKEVGKFTNILKGDTNEDGIIDSKDSEIIFDYILNKTNFADDNIKAAADINGDGKVTLADYVKLYHDMEG